MELEEGNIQRKRKLNIKENSVSYFTSQGWINIEMQQVD